MLSSTQLSVSTSIASGRDVFVGDYKLLKCLGSGSFGDIYLGRHTQHNSYVAVKMEKTSSSHPQLNHEYKVYKILKAEEIIGFPKVYYFGTEAEYNVLVMDRLGSNLEELFSKCSRKFSYKTILMLADQMVRFLLIMLVI
jgi:serine/threonine protein kinase